MASGRGKASYEAYKAEQAPKAQPSSYPTSFSEWISWLPAILGMDLETLFRMFFVKSAINIPGQGSVLMTDYEKTKYTEGYNAHEAYVTDPVHFQPKETQKPVPPDPSVAKALEAEKARVAAMNAAQSKQYWAEYDNAEQYRMKQAEQRAVFTNTNATVTPQPSGAKTVQPPPKASPNPTPAPDYTAGPAPDSAYSAYEARRSAGRV